MVTSAIILARKNKQGEFLLNVVRKMTNGAFADINLLTKTEMRVDSLLNTDEEGRLAILFLLRLAKRGVPIVSQLSIDILYAQGLCDQDGCVEQEILSIVDALYANFNGTNADRVNPFGDNN